MYKYELFQRVALARNFLEKSLYQGDIATIVDRHLALSGEAAGYSLEVFNAVGETIAVIVVDESDLQPLRTDEVLHVRALAVAA
jgi:hypothetical protein